MANYIIINGELYHWGVKGMKWGVRKLKKYTSKAKTARESADEWDEMARIEDQRGRSKKASKYRKNAQRDRQDADKFDRKAQDQWDTNVREGWHHAYNSAANKINDRIDAFNDKYKGQGVDLNNPKSETTRKYVEEYTSMWNDIYTKELDSAFGKAIIDDGRKWCDRVWGFENPNDILGD